MKKLIVPVLILLVLATSCSYVFKTTVAGYVYCEEISDADTTSLTNFSLNTTDEDGSTSSSTIDTGDSSSSAEAVSQAYVAAFENSSGLSEALSVLTDTSVTDRPSAIQELGPYFFDRTNTAGYFSFTYYWETGSPVYGQDGDTSKIYLLFWKEVDDVLYYDSWTQYLQSGTTNTASLYMDKTLSLAEETEETAETEE